MKFGWCSDEMHKSCVFHYRDRYEPEKLHECSCECHKGKKKPKPPPMHEAVPDPSAKIRRKSKKKA